VEESISAISSFSKGEEKEKAPSPGSLPYVEAVVIALIYSDVLAIR
jgi:hypothetical protein